MKWVRKARQELEGQRLHTAALWIQSVFRGHRGRKRYRDGSLRGWELVQQDGTLENGGMGSVVLSYHMFVADYDIEHGDTLHAVIRRQS